MTTETTKQVKTLFELGRTLATPGALSKLTEMNINLGTLLSRHIYGDWQEMDAEDQEANREAVNQEARIFPRLFLVRLNFG